MAKMPPLKKPTTRQKPQAKAPTHAKRAGTTKGVPRNKARANARTKPAWKPNPKYATVIQLLEICPTIRTACKIAKCSSGSLYRDMVAYPKLRNQVEEAQALGYELMEAEAFRMAMEGDEEFVVSGGRIVMREVDDKGYKLDQPIPLKRRKKSERMLELILKGNMREKYGTSRSELTGKDGTALTPSREQPAADLTRLSDDEFATLSRITKKAMGLTDDDR